MRRVLHVGLESPALRVGGLNRYLAELADAERALGWDVSVVWISADVTAGATAVPPGRSWLRRLGAFARVIRQSPADVIDVHFPAHAIGAVLTGSLRRRPLVVHFQGPWALESRSAGGGWFACWVKGRVEGAVLRRADLVITLSNAFRRVAVEQYRVPPHRVAVDHPGVRRPDEGDREAARADLGVPDGATLWVAVRRLVPRMGLDVALAAFATGSATVDRFVVAGDGPARAALVETARSLGVADRVQFVGVVNDATLARLYRAADVTLVPSRAHEGFGLVVLESLSHGTPVVVSDVDGLRDAARVSPAVRQSALTPVALRAAADELAGRPALRAAARSSVETLTWTAVATRHLAHYASVLRGERAQSVVWLDHTAALGGGELALARTASALTGRWRPHVIVAADGPLVAELEARGVSVEVLPLPERTRALSRGDLAQGTDAGALFDTLVYAARLRRRLAQRQPAVVHTNSMKANIYGTVASQFAPWRSVMHVRDRWRPPYVSARIARDLRWVARWGPDAVVANSASTASAVGRFAAVIGSPVEEEFFRVPAPASTPVLRVGVIGRLAPWKGQDLAVEAIARVAGTIDCRLVIVGAPLFGEDAFAASLGPLAAARGVADRVALLGEVRDVPAVLTELDVVVLTSRLPEPFGNVVVEAMAAGRPVVVPNRGGVTEYVIDDPVGGSGYFYEIGDADALAAVLQRVGGDRAELGRRGAAARAAARAFAAPVVAAALEDLYDHLV